MLWILEQIETLDPAAVLSLLPSVSEARRLRVLRMTREPARVRSVLAELLLRHALREEYGLTELPRIETGEKGKPFFPDCPEIHFNLSHCRSAVACALDASPLGVDVQELRPLCRDGTLPSAFPRDKHCLPAPPVYRVLSEKERAWVEAGESPEEQDRRFTAVWTCKEAWGKALGVGFLYDLKNTAFQPFEGLWTQYGFCFCHLSLPDAYLTLCAARPLSHRRLRFDTIREELQ